MLRSEAIAIIKEQLGFRTDLDTSIIRNLQFAQRRLELMPTKPWFLLSELQTKRTSPDDERVAVPEDFLAEAENMVVQYVPDDATEAPVQLKKDDYDQLLKDFADEEPGEPEAFALQGNYFRIFPLPDDDYLLKIMNFQFDLTLDTDIENGFLKWAPDALIGSAGLLVAQALRDKDAIGIFTQMRNEGVKTLYVQNELREHANRTYQMGGPAA